MTRTWLSIITVTMASRVSSPPWCGAWSFTGADSSARSNAVSKKRSPRQRKRGGILLVQMAVGSLYMFSVPRGYADGFNQWCKQVAAICLTAFLQTTLLFLGLLTFPDHMLMGLGILLAANEVPRIAQQFGLDSSVKVNMMSVVHATTTAVNLTRSLAAGK